MDEPRGDAAADAAAVGTSAALAEEGAGRRKKIPEAASGVVSEGFGAAGGRPGPWGAREGAWGRSGAPGNVRGRLGC